MTAKFAKALLHLKALECYCQGRWRRGQREQGPLLFLIGGAGIIKVPFLKCNKVHFRY